MTITKGHLIYNVIIFQLGANLTSTCDLANHLYVVICNAKLYGVITWVLEAYAFFRAALLQVQRRSSVIPLIGVS
ncbi:MAG: hypothetical protein WCB79_02230 [Halobacteriota archaeon]